LLLQTPLLLLLLLAPMVLAACVPGCVEEGHQA
jgi:hypothetical protein